MNDLDSVLMTHFWLLCGVWVGGIGGLIYYSSLSRHVKSGQLEVAERSRFLKGWVGFIFGSSLVFWLLQLSAGPAATPDYLSWPSPQSWIAVTFNVLLWLWLLRWIFAKGGAEYLARLTALGRVPFRSIIARPLTFRILAVAVLISGTLALTRQMWRS